MPTPELSRDVLGGIRDSLNRQGTLYLHPVTSMLTTLGPVLSVLRGETDPALTPAETQIVLNAKYVFWQLTDDDAVALASACPRISSLGLMYCSLGARGMDALSTLPLTELDCGDAKLKRAAFPSLAKFAALRRLRLSDAKFDDTEADHLRPLVNLEALDIDGVPLTDAGFAKLAALAKLSELHVPDTVTDVGLGAVAGLPLTRVRFNSRTTDAGVQAIAAPGRLEEARFDAAKITDAALAALSNCTGLRTLLLGRCSKVTDAALPHIARCTLIEELSLAGTKVTGKGLAQLEPLTKLHTLHLQQQKLTDKDVPTLARLTSLKLLLVNKNKFTGAGFAALKRALPNCDVNTLG